MFTTIDEVKELTGADVSQETIIMAQGIIESWVGRVEAEVSNANDSMLLGRATAYQAVYLDEFEDVFDQPAVVSVNQYGSGVSFRQDGASPWIAPLAVIACQRLSWRRMRSVKVGSIFNRPAEPSRWATE